MCVIISKFQHRSTVTHNIMKLSYVQNMCIVESLKLKIWLYGACFGSPHDVQTSSLVIMLLSILHIAIHMGVYGCGPVL